MEAARQDGAGWGAWAVPLIQAFGVAAVVIRPLHRIDSLLGSIGSRLDTIGLDWTLPSLDWTILESRLDNMESRLDNMQSRLVTIESAVASRDDSARLARDCSVRIKVWPAKGDSDLACGTLVTIGGSAFLLTNKQVVWQEKSKSKRAIVRVYRSGNRTVAVDPSGTKVHSRLDVALLPVAGSRSANLPLCTIQEELHFDSWKELVGFKVGEYIEQFMNAHIRQIDHGVVIGTLPGTNGYSGLGYLIDRVVAVVHTGKQTYPGSRGPDEMDGARNPVARRIPAWHARDDERMISLEGDDCLDPCSEEEM
jgi:hypothetical protein